MESGGMDGFSRALLGELETQSSEDSVDYLEADFPSITGESSYVSQTSHRVAHVPKHRDLDPKTLIVKSRSISPNPMSSSGDVPTQSSLSTSVLSGGHSLKESPPSNPRKRKGKLL